MKIAFVGQAGAGKDFAASILVNEFAFRRVAFADRLKVEAYAALFGLRVELSATEYAIAWINRFKHIPEMRQFLQAFGVAKRVFMGNDYWIDYALTTVKGYEDSFGPQNWVLTDCRFENEAEALRESGFQLVRVVRRGNSHLNRELASHVSETEQNGIRTDFVLYNPGDDTYASHVETLVAEVAERLGLPGTEPVHVS